MQRHSKEMLVSIIALSILGGNNELQARAEAALAEKNQDEENQIAV